MTNQLGDRTCLPPSVYKTVEKDAGKHAHYSTEFRHRELGLAKVFSTQNLRK